MSTKVDEILELLKSGWCRGSVVHYFMDDDGKVMTEYCLVGALSKVWKGCPGILINETDIEPNLPEDQLLLFERLADSVVEEFPNLEETMSSLDVLLWYNDRPGQRQENIIALLESIGGKQ